MAAELRPSASILWVAVRWRYQSHVNLEIAYDNLEFQVVVAQISRLGRSQDVVQHISLVRSRLEYSSIVWDPYLAQDIEMVQRRGARYVKQEFHHMASVTALLKDLQWPEPAERRREARLALMYKIIHGKVAIPVDDILK